MNTQDRDRAALLQAVADLAERNQAERLGPAPSAPDVDAYRLVIRAVRHAALPALPGDFAERLAKRAIPAGDRASLEDGLVTLLLLGMALGGGGYFLPRFWPLLSSLRLAIPTADLPMVSWPLLLAAAAGLGLAWLIDRLWGRQSGGFPA